MTLQEFIARYNGQGIDFDHAFGNQCMDLAEEYNQEVVGAPRLGGNAIDVWTGYPPSYYEKIANRPDNYPNPGDIVIWGPDPNDPAVATGQYGHIAVCVTADVNTFTSFDQNFPEGSLSHEQPHTYGGVLGWLRPRSAVSAPASQKSALGAATQSRTSTLQPTYVVARGDNLSVIAARFGVSIDTLYEANKHTVGPDKSLIQAGERLTIPAA